MTLSERRCAEDGCVRSDPHNPWDLHKDGNGRQWGAIDPTIPEWRRRAEAAFHARGWVAVKEVGL